MKGSGPEEQKYIAQGVLPAEPPAFSAMYDQIYEALPEGGRFVEIGSWFGHSSIYFAKLIRAGSKRIEFVCVDTFQGSDLPQMKRLVDFLGGSVRPDFERNLREAGVDGLVRILEKPSVEAAQEFEFGTVDAVFIDGEHTVAAVTDDLCAWHDRVRAGGIVSGDDFHIDHVAEALRKFTDARRDGAPFHLLDRAWWYRR